MDKINKIFKLKVLDDSVYFKITFLLWGLVHSVTLGQYVTSYASPIIILWGGLLVIKTIFIDRVNLSNKYLILVYAFLASYVVTIFLNRDLNFLGNTKTLIWGVIMMIALFVNDYDKNKEEVLNDICRISRAVVIATLIISGIALIQFFFNINFWSPRVDGRPMPQGYYAARLWGIYIDPNQACNVAIISMMLSLVVYIKNTLLNRKLLIFNIVVQYIYLVLSGSRGGEIGFIFASIVLMYLVVVYIIKDKIKGIASRMIIGFVLSFIFTFGLISTFPETRKALSIVPNTTYKMKQSIDNISSGNKDKDKEKDKDKDKGNLTVERPDATGSNGRIELWTDGFELSKKFPMFGVGDRNLMIKAQELMPESSITDQYVHNGFLHMLISGGIVAVVIMLILIGIVAVIAIKKIIFNKKYNEEYYVYSSISILIGSILITTIFLTEIFYQNSFTASILWIFMGYLVYLNKNEDFTCE
ncbi:MAG: O-antigen ligase family protein [Romboutsia sp.]